MLECVLNVSEGRDRSVIAALAEAAGTDLLDLHTDAHHHRTVLTLIGEEAPRRVTTQSVERLDLRRHEGAHPRLGVVDVVPFVPLEGSTIAQANAARDAFAGWLATEHRVPCFLYGEERSLPHVRRHAFGDLVPDTGPARPHPSAGATCVGARPPLVAYNLWLGDGPLELARSIAAAIRRPGLRALGLQVGDAVQVSMNLVDPVVLGPADAYDLVAARATIARAELVGLLPHAVLEAIDRAEWSRLDLDATRTIEARLAARG